MKGRCGVTCLFLYTVFGQTGFKSVMKISNIRIDFYRMIFLIKLFTLNKFEGCFGAKD